MSSSHEKEARKPKAGRHGRRRIWTIVVAAVAAIGAIGFGANTAFADDAVRGIDVSGHQGNVDWNAVTGAGYQFAMVKATEGTGFTSDSFAQQYTGSYEAGMIRGAYHFGLPNTSSGAEQANFFADHGGAWSADDHTLPGTLDIEWNPYGDTCYGMDAAGIVGWVHDFVNTYKERTGRDPIIYTAASWWNQCTGGNGDFAASSPLWVAHYGVDSPAIPGGFGAYSFWQHSSTASVPGVAGNCDVNVWNGTADRLLALANNTP